MQITISDAIYKVNTMRNIVRDIESGGSVDNRLPEIADFLDEYIMILSNTKVNV